MDYYIKPEQEETDFLRISSPEEIKICDPACGSGHMLVYAFDLLYAIYEEEGYDATEIPLRILQNNLYGFEIDERAGELAAFALFMKARARYRRFFRKPVQPNICVLENIAFVKEEIETYMSEVGRDLFTAKMQTTLSQFEEADNFGSLIRPASTDTTQIRQTLERKNIGGTIFLHDVHQRVIKVLKQADYLSPKYHVVVTNPPYMGGRGMNGRLRQFMQDNYGDVKSDLFSAFVVRCLELTLSKGQLGLVTPFVWMFISSYEKLRKLVLSENAITNLVQLEYNAFEPACIPVCAFTLLNSHDEDCKGSFIRLSDFRGSDNQAPRTLEAIRNPDCGWFYRASAADFKKIPGSPIAYWASRRVGDVFQRSIALGDVAEPRQGLATGDNDRFMRLWFEVSHKEIGFGLNSRKEARASVFRWFPYNKGGEFRKWYGNQSFIVNWENDGEEIKNLYDESGKLRSRPQNTNFYFREAVTWTLLSSSYFGVRYMPQGAIFDINGMSCFADRNIRGIVAFMASKLCHELLKIINPTLAFQVGDIKRLPLLTDFEKLGIENLCRKAISYSRRDWDSYETSWDFADLPILFGDFRKDTLANTFAALREHWAAATFEFGRLEEENNRVFIDAYGLQDELKPDVPLEEITLTCNPHYRYGNGKSEEEYEALLLSDSMKEFISYGVGCMFGRYSILKPGLILANQGETVADYIQKVGKHETQITFIPDEDNIIPLLGDEYFSDDIAGRFLTFLKITFGEEPFEENLKFIEVAIGKSIRAYFVRDFYADHVKRYKKRPIYWLFSSQKKGFNALIYMHRYRSDTLSRLLNEYLREYMTKLEARQTQLKNISLSESASVRDRKQADKEISKVDKVLKDVREYEHTLYQLAAQKIEIDLDDGVKVNYCKFKEVLAPIAGLCS